jgi:hypothetical protein
MGIIFLLRNIFVFFILITAKNLTAFPISDRPNFNSRSFANEADSDNGLCPNVRPPAIIASMAGTFSLSPHKLQMRLKNQKKKNFKK